MYDFDLEPSDPPQARYWTDFTRTAPDLLPHPTIVSLEPEVPGTWKVRVRYHGQDVFAARGLPYSAALDAVLGAFAYLDQEAEESPAA